ncbi:MAG: hypothetical protein IKB34_07450 [Clostridia bacterium]|nr:hypothetical protein [Clostridia bacterium]
MKKELRIGAINWDAGLPEETYFGHYTLNTLGCERYAHRLPYYAVKKDDGEYSIPQRTQEQYDRELTIAADAGIDFFMYCWYPDGTTPKCIGDEHYGFLTEHVPELNKMRKLYQTSPINKRIKMCAILIGLHSYAEKDLEELMCAMKEDYYEKKDGRPLVFIFGGYRTEFFSALRNIGVANGVDPYIIFMNNGKTSENGNYSEADAVSAYASGHSTKSFEEFSSATNNDNEKRRQYGIPVIPLLSAGWNPKPRIDRPSPWVTYGDQPYAPAPTSEQMEAAARNFFKWIDNTPEANTGYGVVFAWNEFEEGGYLCPTLSSDGKPCTEILDGLSRALKQR